MFWPHARNWRILGHHVELGESLDSNMEQRLHLFILTHNLVEVFIGTYSGILPHAYMPMFLEDSFVVHDEER